MDSSIRPLSGSVPEPKSTGRIGDASNRRSAESTASGVKHAHTAERTNQQGAPAEEFGVPVPPEFAADPNKMRTEWGWRRFLVQTLNEQQTTDGAQTSAATRKEAGAAPQPANLTMTPQPSPEDVLTNTVQTLWHTLRPLLNEPSMQGQTLPAANWLPPGVLLSLSNLSEPQFKDPAVPEKVKRMAVAEKLGSAVQNPTLLITGSGFFYPPVYFENDRREAVYWEAERQPTGGQMGQPAQHLLVKINVEDKLVELHFMFTKADFSLHIRTDDASLREGLAYSQSYAHTALLKAGWEISQFSVGKLAETRGEL